MNALLLALQIGSLAPPFSFDGPSGPAAIDTLRGNWIAVASGISPEAAKNLSDLEPEQTRLKSLVLGPEDVAAREALGIVSGKRLLLFNPNLRLVRVWDTEPSRGFAGELKEWLDGRSLEPGDRATDPRAFLIGSGALPPDAVPQSGEKGLAVIFLQTGGAVDGLYLDRLKEVGSAASMAGIAVIGLFPAFDESLEDVTAFGAALGFSCVTDPGGAFADAYRASRTPEVFLLNAAGSVVYTGAIDSSTWGSESTRPYLLDAIGALAEGKSIRPAKTFPFGTLIRRSEVAPPPSYAP